MNFEPVMFI